MWLNLLKLLVGGIVLSIICLVGYWLDSNPKVAMLVGTVIIGFMVFIMAFSIGHGIFNIIEEIKNDSKRTTVGNVRYY